MFPSNFHKRHAKDSLRIQSRKHIARKAESAMKTISSLSTSDHTFLASTSQNFKACVSSLFKSLLSRSNPLALTGSATSLARLPLIPPGGVLLPPRSFLSRESAPAMLSSRDNNEPMLG